MSSRRFNTDAYQWNAHDHLEQTIHLFATCFSFCETAESKNKIHAFDTTVVRGCGMYEKLVKMKYIVMFRNFIAKKEGNVTIKKPHLTFHRNTGWMKMAATPHYWFYLSDLSPFILL